MKKEKQNTNKKNIEKLIPDTSIIIEGIVSKKLIDGTISPKSIIIHEAVVAELEAQANKGREIGSQGLEEIKKIRAYCEEHDIPLSFKGARPGDFEIKYAKSGEIDSIIRNLAGVEKGTLITGDKVQCLVAESKGIDVILVEFEEEQKQNVLEHYFNEQTMSVHLREGTTPKAKNGKPGAWTFDIIENDILTREFLQELSKEIITESKCRKDGYIEMDRKGSTIIQLANYRIVITRPPFSDGYEITAVRPVKSMKLFDYALSEKLRDRIEKQAEGILIAGAPGHGKTTFATGLALAYMEKKKIVKTIEAPRDLALPDEITQLSISHGSSQEIHDVLLLTRPDYTIFDEMRNTDDFTLFADLRLSGVGMVGVLHATNPIDAIQRFIGRIELGVIPHVIDTVIFIRNGEVGRVFSVTMEVKVPSGMTEADLARPIVVVHDFETGKLEFEIYSYGEETVVIPIKSRALNAAEEIAAKSIEEEFKRFSKNVRVDIIAGSKAIVYVPQSVKALVIGKAGRTIEAIQDKLGISIDVRELEEAGGIPLHTRNSTRDSDEDLNNGFDETHNKNNGEDSTRDDARDSVRETSTEIIRYQATIDKKTVSLHLPQKYVNTDVIISVDDEYLLSARVSKKGVIKIIKGNAMGKILVDSINNEGKVTIRAGK